MRLVDNKDRPLKTVEFLCSPLAGSTARAAHSAAHQDPATILCNGIKTKLTCNIKLMELSFLKFGLTNSLLILRPKSFSGCAISLLSFTLAADEVLEQAILSLSFTLLWINGKLIFGSSYDIPGRLIIIKSLMQSVPMSVKLCLYLGLFSSNIAKNTQQTDNQLCNCKECNNV